MGWHPSWRHSLPVLGSRNDGGDLQELLGYHDGFLYFMSGSSDGGIVRLDVRLDATGRLVNPAADGANLEGSGQVLTPRTERTAPTLSLGPHLGPATLTAGGILTVDGDFLKVISFDLERADQVATLTPEDQARLVRRIRVVGGLVFLSSPHTISAYAPQAANDTRVERF